MTESTNLLLIASMVILFIWNGVLTFFFIRSSKVFKNITKGISKKDLKTILKEIADSLKNIGSEIKAMQSDMDDIESEMKTHIQKTGFVRFNPFSDTGGNQSFSFCLLDDRNDGIVITSLHSRDSTRIYAKKIVKGKADQRELSKEEKDALKNALKR